jgi:hypothetical protein
MSDLKFPIGIQDFGEIRQNDYLYVDKTDLVYKLAADGKYYFLSRPRRFGKSLLMSTFEAYFQGKKELFDGLALSKLEEDWKTYPVFHLDLNAEKFDEKESVFNILNEVLCQWEQLYGSEDFEKTISARFRGVIRRAYEQTGKRVVILVDEYDKPLLQTIGNDVLQDEFRSMLKAFYGVLKSSDRYIRFAFITGVTKFGKLSVFSDLNNLTDISLLPQYATMCGITEKELHENFDSSVELLANINSMSKAECYEKLRTDYDGYRFCPNATGVYNPFSLLSTLSSRHFGDYWFETGTPSFLVHQLQKAGYKLENFTEDELTADTLNSLDVMDKNPLPLLYQSGYLTIKDYDAEFGSYRLGFPNREVEKGFVNYLIPFYTPSNGESSDFFVSRFVRDVRAGKVEDFMQRLEAMLADVDYQIVGKAELYFQNALYLIFKMLGLYVEVERHTSNGRMDIVMQTKDYIYIFELKMDGNADDALKQIEEKGYARPFANDNRKLFEIGVNFSSEKRCIDGWKMKKS